MFTQTLARSLKDLHKPGSPIVLVNVYDVLSAQTVASLPNSSALATASYAVAAAHGTTDENLNVYINLSAIASIAAAAKDANKPLTVDIQDGYGESLEKAIGTLIDLGVVGVNLEDCDKKNQLYSPDAAEERIKRALGVVKSKGIHDFVVNARCDMSTVESLTKS